ncbi:hypothetical protein BU24DRAFT_360144 [Aaosphaeria arxii CBS 175.79]|uniref:Uncharacterized protein n=1 Tax=Aaosphaeria arxii CBS 175.79 TaxID=1450172 RepID=A0A6A5X6K5_9PLEO|nr:uncharacterized protein BU24DRAFT_360144 [Aaosphaeria arxii CBS 175.79]KAF2008521.1 hypothetical protein BU24DRAFT_360144 [Aaosphaeria arxii CBS 175.79]
MKGSELTNGRKQTSSNKHHTSDHGSTADIDFDDKYFAERLRQSYRSLAGGWLRRTLSSRTLKYIELGRVSPWSGYSSCRDFRSAPSPPPLFSRLLARGRGRTSVDDDDASPFTEHNLMDLYRNPPSGKARYTWVHWARRLAASNESRTREDLAFDPLSMSNDDGSSSGQHNTITSIQFVHGFSVLRIASALAFILASSIAAALLWVFLGRSGWVNLQAGGRGERVGPGVLAGILGLFVQLVLFAAWLILI